MWGRRRELFAIHHIRIDIYSKMRGLVPPYFQFHRFTSYNHFFAFTTIIFSQSYTQTILFFRFVFIFAINIYSQLKHDLRGKILSNLMRSREVDNLIAFWTKVLMVRTLKLHGNKFGALSLASDKIVGVLFLQIGLPLEFICNWCII